jgi:hypothetical protein
MDPDPSFHFNADPDPDSPFHFNADPDPASKNNEDPDPQHCNFPSWSDDRQLRTNTYCTFTDRGDFEKIYPKLWRSKIKVKIYKI